MVVSLELPSTPCEVGRDDDGRFQCQSIPPHPHHRMYHSLLPCVLSTKNIGRRTREGEVLRAFHRGSWWSPSVRMPQGAKIEARPFDIMSAPESEEHETRVVFDAGQERLVLMVHESFAFAGDEFEKDVRDWVTKWKGKYRIEPVQLPTKGLKAVSVIPLNNPDHTRSDDATFVEGVFVESHDRTIQSLDVYVNAAAEKDLESCKAVARQILLSVAPGKKKLKLAAGERRLLPTQRTWRSPITVPKNMVATKQVGPDFLVHRLIVLGRLGADSGSIGIYVGIVPDFDPGHEKERRDVFGKKVEWHSFQHGGGCRRSANPRSRRTFPCSPTFGFTLPTTLSSEY